ncbi:NUDIX hydrolase [Sphingobacterium zeae]|uniref:8-oxo-dGTP diphosphatase n=1 Tax=Sphingobacterium zeae TaxID=1776859 RepID=A0ABU0U6K4_9SPHI|nr:NUDIX domain-containing protein [Sphingobacterium zeae]MDQ1150582.1 8-oxo-dGTP diphosphatase [Sphingobacterium zeae]
MDKIVICSAAILNPNGDLLMVRKKGSTYFQLPGGKATPGESQEETLIRELREELRFDVLEKDLEFLGSHTACAVNEVSTLVEGNIYVIKLMATQSFQAYEELVEVVWIEQDNWQSFKLAHLAAEFVVPRWLSGKL